MQGDAVLGDILLRNCLVGDVLRGLRDCPVRGLMVGSGAVAQTVWNGAHGFELNHGIRDIDVVFFGSGDEDAEDAVRKLVVSCIGDPGVAIDVKDQARVHEWYPRKFGHSIRPYTSIADAISTWPTTATAVGVRLEGETLDIVAPFGLSDLLTLVVRPNRVLATESVFLEKTRRWLKTWPELRVLSWSDGIGSPGRRWMD